MHLDNEPFSLIKDGHKIIEVRLNDIKRQSIEVGDIIKFINKKTGQNLEVRVVNLLRYPDFDSLFDSCDIHDFGSNNKTLSLEKMRNYYSKEEEKEYGVLGIKIKLLK
jgi:ASC-1-like (ASCH) protein